MGDGGERWGVGWGNHSSPKHPFRRSDFKLFLLETSVVHGPPAILKYRDQTEFFYYFFFMYVTLRLQLNNPTYLKLAFIRC